LTPAQAVSILASVAPGDDLSVALAAASAAAFTRDTADEDQFAIDVAGSLAGRVMFLVFDSTDAEDLENGDTPPFLESVATLGAAGSTQRVNISLHTTMIAQQVRAQLDPDGDGLPIADSAIAALIQAADLSTVDAVGADSLGRDLYPGGADPLDVDDDDLVHNASRELGLRIRTLAALTGLSIDEILAALGADAADGEIDGLIPALLDPSAELAALAQTVYDEFAREDDDSDYAMFAAGPCSSSAVALRRACSADVIDDTFEGRAICADISDAVDRAACIADVEASVAETADECDDIFDARLLVCEAVGDAGYDPLFGALFAANFEPDPTLIGDTVEPNPYFPLVPGNHWVYEGGGETITIDVLDETKLIDGITCLTVHDVVTEDGLLIEDTMDWYAQTLSGDIWYCGEIAKNVERFDGDDPELAELVDIEGSWKHGRDGAEAGLLLPLEPVLGTTIRQEVLYGEAEDVIDVLSLTADEGTAGDVFTCNNACLQTRDYTPLDPDPDSEEHKFYVPGIGLIVEVKPATMERLDLVEFTPAP
jgi:hypothetical protein